MRNHMAAGWFYSPSQIVRYFLSRPTSLKPPKTHLRNPYAVLKQLDKHQWLLFFCGWAAWTWDAFDFFTVSLTITEIAKDFGEKNSDVSWGITVTLMLRAVGALLFGTAADRFGRKIPMVVALVLFIILELGSGFCQNLNQFLAVRSLYGICMGGMLGPAAATALEDLPYEARGILSGFFQQGYGVGYLLAALFYRALVPTTTHGWRSLFWFGAGPPVLIIIYRLLIPETNYFQVSKAEREARMLAEKGIDTRSNVTTMQAFRAFAREAGRAFAKNWVLFCYMVVLMAGFNACSHGSQDFYPTFLKNQVELGPSDVTIVTCVGQIGAVLGGTTMGYISAYTGRRPIMMFSAVCGGAIVPAYILPRNMSLVASAFFQQFFVGGVWGPIPIHLMELSPPALRSLMLGFTYQLGNLASSASATIQSIIGEKYPLPPGPDGTKRFDYGKVIAIFMGTIWAYQLFFLFFGPEMSQEEREEHGDSAAFLETSRKEGMSLAEIGAMRVKTHDSDGRVLSPELTHDSGRHEKNGGATHFEDEERGEVTEKELQG